MTNKEFLEAARERKFTDNELLEFLMVIVPDSKSQLRKIHKMGNIIAAADNFNSLDEYLELLNYEDVINATTESVYNDYCEWCKVNNFNYKSKTSFSKAIINEFNLKIKVSSINKKSVRVYRAV